MTKKTKQTSSATERENALLEEIINASSILLIVEWNGNAIPQTWYNRLHSYGLYSRRDLFQNADVQQEDGRTLLQWRAEQDGKKKKEHLRGIILQEGIIQLSDAGLAYQLQGVAQSLGAAHTWVGTFVVEKAILPAKDLEVFMAIEAKTSKRGVKPKHETGHYTITCLTEAKTFSIDCDSAPVQCPSCGGAFFQARFGYPISYKFNWDENESPIEEFWSRTRFASSVFEVPVFDEGGNNPLLYQEGLYNPPSVVTDFVNDLFHTWGGDNIKKLQLEYQKNPDTAMRLLDAVYCAGQKARASRGLERRSVWMNHVSEKPVTGNWSFLIPDDDKVDLLDVAKISSEWIKYL